MAMLRFLFRRLVAQRLLALGVVLTLAFSVGVMASGPIYTEAARNSILASAIATASVPVENVRVDLYGGSSFDWAAADRQVRALSSLLPVQTIVPQGETTVRIGPSGGSVPMLFRAGGGAHLAYRSGTAPGAGQASLSSPASSLEIGSRSWARRTSTARFRCQGSSIHPLERTRSGSERTHRSRRAIPWTLSRCSSTSRRH